MGFLRKVGRKIKKGVKKLLGGKFGKILGGIGLAMMFWGGANALFGNTKWFQGLKTNIGKMNPFGKADVTGAVDEYSKLTEGIDIAEGGVGLKEVAVKDLPTRIAEGPTLGESISSGVSKLPSTLKDLPYETGEAIGEYIKGVPSAIKEGDFIPDVLTGAGTAVLTSSVLGGGEEDTGGYGRMPQVGAMEAPQASYVAEVQSQMPQMQGMDFNQLNQSLFYGTLSPQWLMSQTQYG